MAKRTRINPAAAEKSEMPGFIKPQLATLKATAPSGDQWLHEVKFDGYRVQLNQGKGPVMRGLFRGIRRLSSFCRFRVVVNLRFRKLAEGAVGVFLFIKRGIKQRDGILVAQLSRPRL